MANEIQYTCEGCGAPVGFQPGSDSLTCEYCGLAQKIEAPAGEEESVREIDFRQAVAQRKAQPAASLVEGGRELRCQACGATTVLEGQAGHCPYCDSPMVAAEPSDASIVSPESVLPFKVDGDAARRAFHEWVSGLWFAPNDLNERARAARIDGVYLPYWTYDSDTTSRYSGERGEHYYVTERYTDSEGKEQSRQVRKTRWYSCSGTVRVSFDDVLVCASKSLPPKLIIDLEPWDLERLEPYDPAYLSGFVAERYAIDMEEGFQLAEARMKPKVRSAVRRDIGGDEQRIHSLRIHHADVSFKHCLLPLWISSFRYEEKVYRFMVNARTAEVAGERPWSVIKIVLFVLFIVAVIAAIVFVAQQSGA